MSTTSITIRMDGELKKQAEELFNELGLNMTTAITIFTKAAVRQGRIPFELSIDPFYSEANQAYLKRVFSRVKTGQTIDKTMDELEAIAQDD